MRTTFLKDSSATNAKKKPVREQMKPKYKRREIALEGVGMVGRDGQVLPALQPTSPTCCRSRIHRLVYLYPQCQCVEKRMIRKTIMRTKKLATHALQNLIF